MGWKRRFRPVTLPMDGDRTIIRYRRPLGDDLLAGVPERIWACQANVAVAAPGSLDTLMVNWELVGLLIRNLAALLIEFVGVTMMSLSAGVAPSACDGLGGRCKL